MSKIRRALLILLALAVVKMPLDALLAALLPDVSVNTLPACIAGAAVTVLLLGVPAWHLRPWTSERLVREESPWVVAAVGAGMGVLCRMALAPVDAVWRGWLHLTPETIPAPEGIPAAMVCVLTLAVIPALAEEAFFRGALLTALLDGSRRITAVVLTALAFALMHGNAANLPSLLGTSLLLTLLMLRTGHIIAPVTMHLVYNLTAFVRADVPFWESLLCGAALTAAAIWSGVRREKYAHPPMKRQEGLIAGAALAALAAQYFV